MEQIEQNVPATRVQIASRPLSDGANLPAIQAPKAPENRFVAWMRLFRLPTLMLGLAPVCLTLVFLWATGRPLLWLPAISMIIAVSFVMTGASMLDEYLEFERSVHRRWNSNNGAGYYVVNVLEGTGIKPLRALRASLGLLILGVLAGLPLISSGRVVLVLLGILGLVVAFLYSATNYALKRLPAGELAIFLALGPGLSIATALSQRQIPDIAIVTLGLALGAFTLALVLAAHMRDHEADKAIARKTLIQVNGKSGGRMLYTLCLIMAYLLIAVMAQPKGAAHGAVLALFSLPATLVAWTGVARAQGRLPHHHAMRATLRAYASFAFWTFLGLFIAGLIVRSVPLIHHYF